MTEHTPVPYGYFKSQESRFFQAETWAITGPEHDHEESWDIVADGIPDEATARFIVTACNCHADLLKACLNSLGAYEALEALGADKELPGYETCLSFLKQIIHKVEGERI